MLLISYILNGEAVQLHFHVFLLKDFRNFNQTKYGLTNKEKDNKLFYLIINHEKVDHEKLNSSLVMLKPTSWLDSIKSHDYLVRKYLRRKFKKINVKTSNAKIYGFTISEYT